MKAIGIPTEMFTAIFAVGRTVGWISHWHEMVTEGLKLAVHASFTGHPTREYPARDKR